MKNRILLFCLMLALSSMSLSLFAQRITQQQAKEIVMDFFDKQDTINGNPK